jgi:hypothetical protein
LLSRKEIRLGKRALGRDARSIPLGCRPQLFNAHDVPPRRRLSLQWRDLHPIRPPHIGDERDRLRSLRPRRTVHLNKLPTVRAKEPHHHVYPMLLDDKTQILIGGQNEAVDMSLAPFQLSLLRRAHHQLGHIGLRRLLLGHRRTHTHGG